MLEARLHKIEEIITYDSTADLGDGSEDWLLQNTESSFNGPKF